MQPSEGVLVLGRAGQLRGGALGRAAARAHLQDTCTDGAGGGARPGGPRRGTAGDRPQVSADHDKRVPGFEG